jgi:RNA polymerase sigma-70 factor (ECF subfamily)
VFVQPPYITPQKTCQVESNGPVWGTRRRDLRREHTLGVDADQSSDALDQSLVAPQSSPSQQASRRERDCLLTKALAHLPDDYREVLVLHHLEECTFPEVARRMGRSLDSVKHLWTRALARLRQVLEGTS